MNKLRYSLKGFAYNKSKIRWACNIYSRQEYLIIIYNFILQNYVNKGNNHAIYYYMTIWSKCSLNSIKY